ncbi:Flavin-containing monooxygenase [Psidium guajava]|nr:Flavin-containing monooxygenase [Psidium guajava]
MQPKQRVAIVGAGISGLVACKHLIEKGFDPVVFEAHGGVGGVWSRTIESTKLQTPKQLYQFSDFPWPASVTETFPGHQQVMRYLVSYASRFGILPKIKFNCKVTRIDYVVEPGNAEDMSDWETWSGSHGGRMFFSGGKWDVVVQDTVAACAGVEVYQVDFVVLCIGMFSDLPRVPEFPMKEGPEAFEGKVLHSMDYAMMGRDLAAAMTREKRVTVVGSQKSAIDIAVEVARRNGRRYPCTLLFKTAHWTLPDYLVAFIFRNLNRFVELMVHKPGEGLFLWLLAVLLSPLMAMFSKWVETYLRWVYPLKKYDMVPDHSLVEQFASCMTPTLPSNFYHAAEGGSLILKKSPSFRFCHTGLILDGGTHSHHPTDVVIFATGYESDEKLKNIFSSNYFQKCLAGSSYPLYRECIHPRIPQLAILGYADSPSVLYTTEMRSKWLSQLLAGQFELPTTREMEDEARKWERCMRRYVRDKYKRYRVSVMLQIYCNDQLCRDMRCNPRRKNSLLSELFASYGPSDYENLIPES